MLLIRQHHEIVFTKVNVKKKKKKQDEAEEESYN